MSLSNAPQARTWCEIDCRALRHNVHNLARLIAPAQLAPVIKSNAYGHGLVEIAQELENQEIWGFCVVDIHEGISLREAGITKPILVIGPNFEWEWEEAIHKGLTLAVYDSQQAKILNKKAQKLHQKVRIHLKVDSGLGRLAPYSEHSASWILQTVKECSFLQAEGVFSHLADAEGYDQSYTILQYRRFQQLLSQLSQEGFSPPLQHIAGSAASLLLEKTRLSLVRTGIAIYGLWPSPETRLLLTGRGEDLFAKLNHLFEKGETPDLDRLLQPVLSWKTRLYQTKVIPSGCKIGYGCTYETERETRIGILPVGYAEGWDRSFSNQGKVLIRDRKVRVIGRVCMNLTILDLTDHPQAQTGDEVILVGKGLSAEEQALKLNTIHYELLTRIPKETLRIYLNRSRPLRPSPQSHP